MSNEYARNTAIVRGLKECRDELLEVDCDVESLRDLVIEASSFSAPQVLVLGVFLTMHAQTAIDDAIAKAAPAYEEDADSDYFDDRS